MASLAGVAWPGVLGQVFLAIVVLLGNHLTQARNFNAVLRWGAVLGVVCSAWVPIGFMLAREPSYTSIELSWRHYYAMLAWWILVAVLAGNQCMRIPARSKWVWPILGGALVCGTIWVASSYWGNYRIPFYLGLTTLFALLILCALWLKLPWLVRQALITAILLILLLPVANLLFNRVSAKATLTSSQGIKVWTYGAARRDPLGHERWWQRYSTQIQQMLATLVMLDPETKAPSRLCPNSHALLGESLISVNHLGFRGPEFPEAKGNAYRIVALGESTTFGFTTAGKDDKPWPELLEKLIQERLKPRRPVQVINAGIPSIELPDNLRRLPTQILPLKPDTIISYHGVNGFHLLDSGIPKTHGEAAPDFCERPFRLLAECEYRLKLAWYRRKLAGTAAHAGPPADLPNTLYGESYRHLIHIARTNSVHLVLGNFSMAVNATNAPDEVQFFRALVPGTLAIMRANVLHSELVRELGLQNPDVRIVDTHPNLDGNPEMFIDLVHPTPDGEQQLAENFFVGLRDILEQDLVNPRKPPSAP